MKVLRPFIVNPTENKKEDATALLSIVKNEDESNDYYFKESDPTKYKMAFIADDINAMIASGNQVNDDKLKDLDPAQKDLFVEKIQGSQFTLFPEIWSKEYYQTFEYDGVEYLFEVTSNPISNYELPFLFYGKIVGFGSEGNWTKLEPPTRAMVIGPVVDPVQGILKEKVQFPNSMTLTGEMLNEASTDSFKDVLFPPERPVAQLTDPSETVDTPGLAQSVDATSPEPTSTPSESDEESDSDDDDGASGGETDSEEDQDDTLAVYTSKKEEYTKEIRRIYTKLNTRLNEVRLKLETKKNEIDKLPRNNISDGLKKQTSSLSTQINVQSTAISALKDKETKENNKSTGVYSSNNKETMRNEISRIDAANNGLKLLESGIERELKNINQLLDSLQLSSPRLSDPSSSAGTISTPARPPATAPSTPQGNGAAASKPPPPPASVVTPPTNVTAAASGPSSVSPSTGTQTGTGPAASTSSTVQPVLSLLSTLTFWIIVDPNPFPILDSNALFNQGTVGVSNFDFFGIKIQARKIDSLHFALQQQFPRLRANSDRRRTPVTSGFVVFFQYKDDGSAVLSLVGGTKVPISNAQYTSLLRRFPNSKGKHYRDESLADGLGGQEIVAMREANGGVRPMWYARFSHY